MIKTKEELMKSQFDYFLDRKTQNDETFKGSNMIVVQFDVMRDFDELVDEGLIDESLVDELDVDSYCDEFVKYFEEKIKEI